MGFGIRVHKPENEAVVVVSLEPESPAAITCSILSGDVFVKMNGTSCAAMSFADVCRVIESSETLEVNVCA